MIIVNQTKFKLSNVWLEKIIQQIWQILSLDSTKTINLVLVESDEIKKLNQRYRQKNQVTDILSFSYKQGDFWPEPTDDNIVGELVICLAQIKKQAKAQKISWQTELTLILIHGILHLIGMDHATKIGHQQMESKTQAVLKEFNF